MKINIIFENKNFLVVEKPSGIIVHPWSECADKVSLLKILRDQTGKFIYPVHRLDRPVSGVMIFAFSSESANFLKQKWQDESTQKVYIGLCKGVIPKEKYISYPLFNQARTAKQEARTNFWPLKHNDHVTLALFKIATGRYHQIRRHLGAMGHQLIGDTKYGKGNFNRFYRENYHLQRLFLHCCGLRIDLGDGTQSFISPLTPDLEHVVSELCFDYNIDDKIFGFDPNNLTPYSKRENIV